MLLDNWAARWGVPPAALQDLRRVMVGTETDPKGDDSDAESAVQNRVRIEASKQGLRLWRNNVGACTTDDNRFIRYGLANDSKQMNASIKSSDLIGIKPVWIIPEMVGTLLGQFVAYEIKRNGWKYRGTKREEAQLKFLNLTTAMGGDGRFLTGPTTF